MNGTNRLAAAPSPYLRQHAENPVHWWEWSDEAFDEAKRRDVPVFLSIGYATCHWCHVMAHESFEDDDVAALMNDAFVCIKVDREERPDIDAAYMAAIQASGQRGGWPLTAVLDHERRPWFLGTYLPKNSHGRIGMMELIPKLQDAWTKQRDDVHQSAAHLLGHIRQNPTAGDRNRIGMDLIVQAVDDSKQRFDEEYGGFGPAPKFPSPQQMLLLLRHHRRTGDVDALRMVEETLTAMARGGIHDHVGGGFHRYSTDRQWHLPHFEKMLYDQAMLMCAYAEAYQATGNEDYVGIIDGIADYVQRDLQHADGGFFCAEDADSDGEEGTFYIWAAEELKSILGAEADSFMDAYGCKEEGNFHDESTGKPIRSNILHAVSAANPGRHRDSLNALFEARKSRTRPLLDDKILADWNGLMIAALAKAGAAMERDDYVETASRAARFILGKVHGPDGLHHRWHEGAISSEGFLDDHAFMAWATLELFHATQDAKWLQETRHLLEQMLRRFSDDGGRLQLIAHDAEAMVVEATSCFDGAMPSGTSIAIACLERFGRLTAEPQWVEAAWNAVLHVDGLADHPSAFHAALLAVPGLVGNAMEVVVTGPDAEDLEREMRTGHHPDAVYMRRALESEGLPDWVSAHDGAVDAAFVCRGQSCDAPVHDVVALRNALQI